MKHRNLVNFIAGSIIIFMIFIGIFYYPINLKSYINTSNLIIFGIWLVFENFFFIIFFSDYLEKSVHLNIKFANLKFIFNISKLLIIIVNLIIFLVIKPVNGIVINSWTCVTTLNIIRILFGLSLLLVASIEFTKFTLFRILPQVEKTILYYFSFGFIFTFSIIGFISFIFIKLRALNGINYFFLFIVFLIYLINLKNDKKNQEKKINSENLSKDSNHGIQVKYIVLFSLIFSVFLIVLGSNLLLKYLLYGDMWHVFDTTIYSVSNISNFYNIIPSYYPIFWNSIIYGISKIFGLPVVNTAVIINIFSFVTIITFYQFIKIVFKNIGEKYRFLFIFLLMFLTGSLDWIFYSLGKMDFYSIQFPTYYVMMDFAFFHITLYILSIYWSLIFIIFYIKYYNSRDLTNFQKNVLLYLSFYFLYIAFLIHFIELILFPLILFFIISIEKSIKKFIEFLFKFSVFFNIALILTGVFTNNYYYTFFLYSFDSTQIRFNHLIRFFNYFSFYPQYVLLFIFLIPSLILYIILKKWDYISRNKILSILYLKTKELTKISQRKLNISKKYTNFLIISILIALLIISQILRIIRMNSTPINYYTLHNPLYLLPIDIIFPTFFSIFGWKYLDKKYKSTFLLSIIYLIIVGETYMAARIWHYINIYVISLTVLFFSNFKNIFKNKKISKKKITKIENLLIILFLLCFPTNLILIFYFNTYNNSAIVSDDMAGVLNYLNNIHEFNSTIYIYPYIDSDSYIVHELTAYNYSIYSSTLGLDFNNDTVVKEFIVYSHISLILTNYSSNSTYYGQINQILRVFNYTVLYNSTNNVYSILRLYY